MGMTGDLEAAVKPRAATLVRWGSAFGASASARCEVLVLARLFQRGRRHPMPGLPP